MNRDSLTVVALASLAALVLALCLLAATRANGIAACNRGNLLRRESNHRLPLHERDVRALVIFARATGRARLAEYRHTGDPYSLAVGLAARRAVRLDSHVHFARVPLVDCKRAIPLIPSP